MQILVLADTHIPIRAKELPKVVLESLKEVDLILHAGDLVELEVLRKLQKIRETIAVLGNMDYSEVGNVLPAKKTIKIGQHIIGLTHGSGGPQGIMERLRKQFDQVDCIVFGHTHNPCNQVIDDILFFNPGSPTDTVFAPYKSFGLLKVDETIRGEIIRI